MHVPWRFIIGWASGIILALAFFLVMLQLQVGVPTESSRWAFEIGEKKRALAAAIPGPRLLLVGGSGTTFGLSARTLEAQTGVRTVNLGTHAGLGADYLLYWAKQTARPDDTVLLILEYELYAGGEASEVHDDYVLARDPAYFCQLSMFDRIDLATRISWKRLWKGLNIRRHGETEPRPHPPYTQGANYIDAFGDETGNTAIGQPPAHSEMAQLAKPLLEGYPSTNMAGFEAVRRFLQWARWNRVVVLATFPNLVHRPEYDGPVARDAEKTIMDFYQGQGVPVIGTAEGAMFPSDQYFEVPYHLSRGAAVVRTQRLAPSLLPYLKK